MTTYEDLWLTLMSQAPGNRELQHQAAVALGGDNKAVLRALAANPETDPELLSELRRHTSAEVRQRAWSTGAATTEELAAAVRTERNSQVRLAMLSRTDFPNAEVRVAVGKMTTTTAHSLVRLAGAGGADIPHDLMRQAIVVTADTALDNEVLASAVTTMVCSTQHAEWAVAEQTLSPVLRIEAFAQLLVLGPPAGGTVAAAVSLFRSASAAEYPLVLSALRGKGRAWFSAPTPALEALHDFYRRAAGKGVVEARPAMRRITRELNDRRTPPGVRLRTPAGSAIRAVALWDLLPEAEKTLEAVALVLSSMTEGPEATGSGCATTSVARFLSEVGHMLPAAVRLAAQMDVHGNFAEGSRPVPAWMAHNPEVYVDLLLAVSAQSVRRTMLVWLAKDHLGRLGEVLDVLAGRFDREAAGWTQEQQYELLRHLCDRDADVIGVVSWVNVQRALAEGFLSAGAVSACGTLLARAHRAAANKDLFDATMSKMAASEAPMRDVLAAAVDLSQ